MLSKHAQSWMEGDLLNHRDARERFAAGQLRDAHTRNSSFFMMQKGDFAISCGRAVDECAVALTQVIPLMRVIVGCGAWRSIGAFRF
jgi:hypothetical protein